MSYRFVVILLLWLCCFSVLVFAEMKKDRRSNTGLRYIGFYVRIRVEPTDEQQSSGDIEAKARRVYMQALGSY